MTKKYYKIYTGRYGGELTIGTVNADFAEYWIPKLADDSDSDLIETLQGYEWDDEDMKDPNSPIPKEDFYAWNECDDIEHLNGPTADNQFEAWEVFPHKDAEYVDGMLAWKEGIDHDYTISVYEEAEEETYRGDYEHVIYSRECYSSYTDPVESAENEGVPVLHFFSSEKGGFGEVIVETDGDFDPAKLQVGQVETDLVALIEQYWYDRKPLQVDFDHAESTGKGFYAGVGFMNPKWHDIGEKYYSYDMEETPYVKEAFDELYEIEEEE